MSASSLHSRPLPASSQDAFEQAVRQHDDLLARHRLVIWVGGEPTFTDRGSESSEWLNEALGVHKEERAHGILAGLQAEFPNSLVLRTVGRQYPGEDTARWSLGLYGRRDGQSIWNGPPDPLLLGHPCRNSGFKTFWKLLAQRLNQRGWQASRFRCAGSMHRRIVFCRGDVTPPDLNDARLQRPSVHDCPIPPQGLRDDWAEQGCYLVALGYRLQQSGTEQFPAPCLELPAFPDVDGFLDFLAVVASAAQEANLESLMLIGYPPPVDASVIWTTLTPDPAVVEINMAPAPDATTFLRWNRRLFVLTERVGLSPYRLHYNGQIADSGGGGQVTLGGPQPSSSPFLVHPRLLPGLVRYLNRHPALSYFFAFDFLGSSSQAPRPDEHTPEMFEELKLSLDLLERQATPSPEMLWQSLAPFLADLSGNSHRSELNIEKLWNPYLPGRGCLGLVEFRALRMASTPEKAAALAVLLRTICASLVIREHPCEDMVYWGRDLHERFALPFYLKQDLQQVLDDLAGAGLGLASPIIDVLLDDQYFYLGEIEWEGCTLIVKRALEFWPLVGDSASQEHGGSRLVDASTARLEVQIRPHSGLEQDVHRWLLSTRGYHIPLRLERDAQGPLGIVGLRYRRFKPWCGLHPLLEAQSPVSLVLTDSRQAATALGVTWHEWKPQGGGYDGLPSDFDEARQRCAERFVVESLGEPVNVVPPPEHALNPYCLDLRWL
ncbi:MAG: transglutaminase family protein [Gammaproteobacteria bacterium]|nr:transglutaminase family protein [Gammaproteobacteria bacterium]